MAPVFDMLNHNHKPNIGWKPNAETHALELYALSDGADGNRRTRQSQNDECEITSIAEYGNRKKRNAQNGQNKRF